MNWYRSWRQKRLEGRRDDLMVKVDLGAEYLAEQDRALERQREQREVMEKITAEAEARFAALPEFGTLTDCPKCVVGEVERDWVRKPLAGCFLPRPSGYCAYSPPYVSKEFEFLVVSCSGCGFVLGREKTADVEDVADERKA